MEVLDVVAWRWDTAMQAALDMPGEGDWRQGTILDTKYGYRWNEGDEKQKKTQWVDKATIEYVEHSGGKG